MNGKPYYELKGFEQVYLEDSWVLDIQETPQSIKFVVETVLTEKHSLYHPALPGEQHCYKKAQILFANVTQSTGIDKSMIPPAIDADGVVDYGNIDSLFFENDHFIIHGDWGKLEIVSSPPTIEFIE